MRFCGICLLVTNLAKTNVQKDEEVELFREKFAGSQADRIVRAEAEAEKIAEKLKKTKVSGCILLILYLFTHF